MGVMWKHFWHSLILLASGNVRPILVEQVGEDIGRLVTDNSGFVYITGGTGSQSQIATSGTFQDTFPGSPARYIAKLQGCEKSNIMLELNYLSDTIFCLGDSVQVGF